jgi:hypothetical protein
MVVSGEDTFGVAGSAYDWSVAGMSFISAVSPDTPYERAFARVNKDMVDSSPQPGDQSLDGWWIRSATDWTAGAGYEFMEPIAQDPIGRTFHWSFGVDVWQQGQLSLLRKPFRNFSMPRAGLSRPCMEVWGGTVYVANGDTVYRIAAGGFYKASNPVAATKHCVINGATVLKLLAAEGDLLAFTAKGVKAIGTGTA